MQTRARQTGMPAAAWGGGEACVVPSLPTASDSEDVGTARPLEGELGSGVRRPREGQ